MAGWVLWAAVACTGGTDHVAVVPDALGLAAGSPVQVSGVDVGEVHGVTVREDGVQVAFTVEPQHDVALHRDACVTVHPRVEAPAVLAVHPGTEGELDGALGPCRLDIGMDDVKAAIRDAAAAAREIGVGLGAAARELTTGVTEGLGGPRATGEALGEAVREFDDGLQDGLQEP